MTTKTIEAIYEGGVVRPREKLPFREHAFLKLKVTIPTTPVSRTRGIIQVSPQTARAIIYGDEAAFFGA
jgi:predicted DNA-binding antitoxin AbrB/MazE fold protein